MLCSVLEILQNFSKKSLRLSSLQRLTRKTDSSLYSQRTFASSMTCDLLSYKRNQGVERVLKQMSLSFWTTLRRKMKILMGILNIEIRSMQIQTLRKILLCRRRWKLSYSRMLQFLRRIECHELMIRMTSVRRMKEVQRKKNLQMNANRQSMLREINNL